MNPLKTAWRTLGLAGRIAAGLAVLVILITVWWLIIGRPAHDRRVAAEAKAAAIVATGQAAAARDAVAIVTDSAKTERAIDAQTQENSDAIHAAPGAGAQVDPGVDAAGRRALCLRHALRDQPACVKLLGPRP
jgi:hypothetical protein